MPAMGAKRSPKVKGTRAGRVSVSGGRTAPRCGRRGRWRPSWGCSCPRGDDEVAGAEGAAVGLDGEAGAVVGHLDDGGGQAHLGPGAVGLGQEEGDDVLGGAVTEELAQRSLVPGEAMGVHERTKSGRCRRRARTWRSEGCRTGTPRHRGGGREVAAAPQSCAPLGGRSDVVEHDSAGTRPAQKRPAAPGAEDQGVGVHRREMVAARLRRQAAHGRGAGGGDRQ
jgi:hypothetical protein